MSYIIYAALKAGGFSEPDARYWATLLAINPE